jgi:protein-S-isoprenylcysteine O-methyltransferase Ste14
MLDSIFEIFWLGGFIIGSFMRGWYRRRSKQVKVVEDRGTTLDKFLMAFSSLGLIVLPLFYVFSTWLDFADYFLPAWSGWIGVAIFGFALWLLWRSHVDLGLNWMTTAQIREDHGLVIRGVFRNIRHPMYTAHLWWAVAQALLLPNWIAGLSFLVFSLPLYMVRVPLEEQMMLEQFGEEYRKYMKRTRRIIPRLF